MSSQPFLTRRAFLTTASAATASSLILPKLVRAVPHFEKSLVIYNVHTGEWFKGIYAIGNHYVPEALQTLKKLLRDWRTDIQHHIHPRLYDMLYRLRHHFRTNKPFHLICGYRSKSSNEFLRHTRTGVAKNSLHMSGKAIDISLEGIRLSSLRDAARALRAGGVGYYPASGFIHMDVRDKVVWW
jgi:uncharacterized protein YcbK (DUF882 family)